jgi:catalase
MTPLLVPFLKWCLRQIVRWSVALLGIWLLLCAWDFARDRAPSGSPMGEKVTSNEEFLTAQIINAAIDNATQQRQLLIHAASSPNYEPPSRPQSNPGFSPYQYRRDAHAKGHGCVLASFRVNDQLEQGLNYGVFAKGGRAFDSIIRFSNGNPAVQADSDRDPHGMAIKLLGVIEGKKLAPTEEKDTTQDFILMDNPVFFIRTLEGYAELNHQLANGSKYGYFVHGLNPLHYHLHEFYLGLRTLKSRPESLVTTRFFSASAYALGPTQYVKYSVIPCAENKPAAVDPKDRQSPDYLRLELAKQSAAGGACFDFAVQRQILGKNMPVEDTTVEWDEADSPFVRVARITVRKVEANNTEAINEQCENTAFNPWHSLADHRPVGVMNRIRQALYQAMSRFRQDANCLDACDTRCNTQKWPDNACVAKDAAPADPKP